MSLEHAILGFLNYGPLSGYDLKKVFDTSVQHFWSADQSQIYRTLARMAENGWTRVETVPQENRPDRKVYHITDEGRAELRRWLTTPLPPEENRSAPLVQVFFAGQLSDEEVLHIFKPAAEQMRQVLQIYGQVPVIFEEHIRREYAHKVHSPRDFFFWMLTLECGVVNARAMLSWMESVIERIENRDYTISKELIPNLKELKDEDYDTER
ncbi:MAG: PadR family transcriptional regulator [Anaerolineae bacterium]|nr:PadR family transcriptional regulator [Anaerolineae bacterium]